MAEEFAAAAGFPQVLQSVAAGPTLLDPGSGSAAAATTTTTTNGDVRCSPVSPVPTSDQDPVIYFVRNKAGGGGGGGGGGSPDGEADQLQLELELELELELALAPGSSPPASPCSGSSSTRPRRDPKDPIAIERLNLMNMAKLSIKGLIESALNLGRSLDSDYAPLQQFFVVMEHCLKHGLKVKKTFLGQNKSFWGALELVEKLCPEAGEITVSVKDLPGLKTPVGRGRAWLRLALMQKKLSDYMKALINRKDLLSEFYEPNALMMEEEGAVIAGLLVGLNVIDVNLCMKGEDLDTQVGVIDFSLYLKDGGHSSKSTEGDGQITAILDQKNYVEELNRHLSATVNNLQAKVDALEKSNTKLTEELAVANNRIITLQEETERIKQENAYYSDSTRKKMEVGKLDGNAEGQAHRQSRQGTDDSHSEARKQLKEETQLRLDVEKELEVQIGMKQEMELAMKMLEKDICDKQDVLVTFRQQLDDVQALNHELSQKVQGSDNVIRQKNEIIARLEEKANQMSCTIKQMEQRLRQTQNNWHSAEEANYLFKQEFGEKIVSLQNEVDLLSKQRSQLEMGLKEQRRSLHNNPHHDNNSEQVKIHQQQMADMKKELEQLHEENQRLRRAGKDKPLNGTHQPRRSRTVIQVEKEPEKSILERQDNVICKLCQEEASVTRPKKRCNNCHATYCNQCAVNELPLPSSIQPVCVCNPCHQVLLQQYSTTPPP
ncbi:protein RUFY3-like isoform X2 [Carcharodon carcharias]|uniref:protein RUFY3-like isoform X2 n=1 Tax=Carcharodon carcharias TaxID=13397 RepID=UPI001B7DFB7E|nr:protein RUFY3-like isoform X2 [Carcharodon carcharias]